jgi:hypothetical protein
MEPNRTCRHCQTRQASEARGMCKTCYRDTEIRELYPTADTRYNRRGCGNGNPPGNLPAEPTQAVPCVRVKNGAVANEEKMAVLMQRAERGESLFHPEDGRL